MREACRGQPEWVRLASERLFDSLLMRQVVQQDYGTVGSALAVHERRDLGADHDRATVKDELRFGIVQTLSAGETRIYHPAEPFITPHQAADERPAYLGCFEESLGGGVRGHWFELWRQHDHRVAKAVYDVAP